jgi:tetratricopeptide (TPR) repeat protein
VYRFYRGPSEGNDDGSFASVSETYIAQNIAAEADAYLKLGEKCQRCKTSEIKSLLGARIDWETTLIAENEPVLENLPEGVSSVIAMWRVLDNVYVGIRADHNTGFKARAYFFAAAEGGKSNGKIDSFEGLPSRAIGNTVLDAYAGNVEALNNLAVLWYCGIANPKDYDEKAVIDMLKRSSQLGCAAAVYNLGILYYNRGEKDKAEKFFSEAKEKGYDLK